MRVFSESEIVKAAARKAGVPQLKAARLVREVKRLVAQELRARHDVALSGLVTFRVVERKAGFGGHKVRAVVSQSVQRALRPKAPTPAAVALRERLRGSPAGDASPAGKRRRQPVAV